MSGKHFPVANLLVAGLFFTGISAASIAPYRAIVAVEGLGMSNQTYALVITISSIATAVASVMMGYIADRIADRRILVIASAFLGGLAYGLIYLFPTQLTYIVAFCVILPFGGALFSQIFSFSRAYYDQQDPKRSEFMMSVLRTVFAAAWVVVPPVAGWLASAYSVYNVLAMAALAHVGCTLIFVLMLRNPSAKIGTKGQEKSGSEQQDQRIRLDRIVGIGGVTLVRVAMVLHLTTLPLAVISDFNGSFTDVGIAASIAAGLEVPCMLAWGIVATRISKEVIIVVNALIYALYMVLLFFAQSISDVLWLQALNAISTAALLSITISYTQEAIKGRVGLSTSLMDVVTVTSALIAAGVFVLAAREGSYIGVFVPAGALSIVGAGVVAFSLIMRTRQA